MSTTSFAVLAKARAKYGKQLTDRDYSNLVACQSVAEVMVYLKSHTHFATALAEINERDVHRGRLEMLLRQEFFNELDTLCHYDSSVSAGFSTYVVQKTEVEQIIRFLILLNSNSTEKFIFQFPAFFAKHTELDINRLANARNYDEVLGSLARTPYYNILKNFHPDAKGRLPVSNIENKLYDFVNANISTIILKNAKGQEHRQLQKLFQTIRDYFVFSQITRLKHYFDLPADMIKSNILTEYTSISPRLIDRMCKAESSAEIFQIMQTTGCGRLISKIGYSHASDITPRIKHRIAKKYIHFSNYPSVVMISYSFLAETELTNVISMIEGVRYQLDKTTIQSLLIR